MGETRKSREKIHQRDPIPVLNNCQLFIVFARISHLESILHIRVCTLKTIDGSGCSGMNDEHRALRQIRWRNVNSSFGKSGFEWWINYLLKVSATVPTSIYVPCLWWMWWHWIRFVSLLFRHRQCIKYCSFVCECVVFRRNEGGEQVKVDVDNSITWYLVALLCHTLAPLWRINEEIKFIRRRRSTSSNSHRHSVTLKDLSSANCHVSTQTLSGTSIAVALKFVNTEAHNCILQFLKWLQTIVRFFHFSFRIHFWQNQFSASSGLFLNLGFVARRSLLDAAVILSGR